MIEQSPISFDRVAIEYDRTRWVPQSLIDKFVNKLIQEVPISRKSRTLEIGVGTGRLAIPLSRHGYKVLGIDISLPMLMQAKQKLIKETNPLYLLRADAKFLPIRKKTFDLCLFAHILHLLEGWKAILGNIELLLDRRNIVNAGLFVKWHELEPFRLYWDAIRNGKPDRVGAKNPQEIIRFLQDIKGYHWKQFEFAQSAGTSSWIDAFGLLKEQIFSSQWRIPNDQHQAALKLVEEKLEEKKDQIFELEAHCIIDLFRLEAED
ncbi:MAG: class I SAM-dependent methyltransferase [Candidatus Hodarchaeota archaeon]